jgi:hypothetical protein
LLTSTPFSLLKKKKRSPAVAPIERVKLLLQTQDSNPKIKSGEIPRYTGIGNWCV